MADVDDTDWWLLLPEPVRALPADLAAMLVLAVVTTAAATVPVVRATPLRVPLGLAYVLFVPGYVVIAALFPEAGESPDVEEDADLEEAPDVESASREGIDGIERVALSFGLSIAIVPLVGLVLNFTPWGIRLVPILVSLDVLIVAAVAVAARRRWALPADERFRVPYRRWYADARAELLEPESRGDAALNALLIISVLLAVGSVGYAVAVPKQGEAFTEFYVLTENESGELVAADYPTEFIVGEAKPVVVGISNHEHKPVRYTVVVAVQRVEFTDNRTNVTVLQQQRLSRYSVRLRPNGTVHRTVQLRPTMVGENLRIVFLLYKGSLPADPTVDNAYRELHLWVNVSETSASIGTDLDDSASLAVASPPRTAARAKHGRSRQ